MSGQSYIGSKISLISLSDIRYVGILHNINPVESTVALQNVRSYGTEGRKMNFSEEIAPSDTSFDYVVFRGSDIKDLQVFEAPPAFQSDLADARHLQQQQQTIAQTAEPQQQQDLRHRPAHAQPNPVMSTMPPPATATYSSAYYATSHNSYNNYNPYGNNYFTMTGSRNNGYWQPNTLSNNFAPHLPQQQHPFVYQQQPQPQPQPPIQMPHPEPYQQAQQAAASFARPLSTTLTPDAAKNTEFGHGVNVNLDNGEKPSITGIDENDTVLNGTNPPLVQEKEEIYVGEPTQPATAAAFTATAVTVMNTDTATSKDADLLVVESLSKQVSDLQIKHSTTVDKDKKTDKVTETRSRTTIATESTQSPRKTEQSKQPSKTVTATASAIKEKGRKKKITSADTNEKSKKQGTAAMKNARSSSQASVETAHNNNRAAATEALNNITEAKTHLRKNTTHRRNSQHLGFTLPKTDFDFASANAKFVKNESNVDETIVIPEPEHFYNKNKSFFDDISCESKEFLEGSRTTPKYREEGKLNIETFGQANAGIVGAPGGRRGRGNRAEGRDGRGQGRAGRANRTHHSSSRRDIRA